jgi:hypothetical protein
VVVGFVRRDATPKRCSAKWGFFMKLNYLAIAARMGSVRDALFQLESRHRKSSCANSVRFLRHTIQVCAPGVSTST